MKRNPLYFAIALAMGMAITAPVMAAGTSKQDEVKTLKHLVELQQKQLDQQQQALQQLRDSLAHLQGEQVQQQAQIQAQAAAPAVVAPAAKPEVPTFASAPGISVAFHGFINATAFSQNKSFTFGNGQNAEFVAPGGPDGNLSGVDVRNTRFWFDFGGAKFAGNWTGGGRIEADFFGGFNGTGAYSQQQPTPRLRQAYMDLKNAETGTTVRIGQQWDLMFPIDDVPTSLSHIAFPLGYGTGMIGWRFPGVVVMQDLNHGSTGPQWRLDVGAFEGSWNGPGNNVNYLNAGNVGFRPQLEARLHVQDKNWLAFFATHYSQVDLRGVDGEAPTPIRKKINSTGYELGSQWKPGSWLFKGLVYTGNAQGEIFGSLAQFGDISDTGGYVQAGYNFTPNWSLNAFYGISKPDTDDVITWLGKGSTGLLKSSQSALSLDYSAGAYALGLELIHDKLDSTTDGIDRKTTSGNQVNVSALYKF